MNDNKYYTAKEALAKAWKYIQGVNAGHTDKVVMFYNISPYIDRDFNSNDGYIHWFLSSSYCARNQILGRRNVRTCWIGQPPDQHFIDSVLKEAVNIRNQITDEIHNTPKYNYLQELDSHYATDEISGLEESFK